ncbi:hypothetical protein CAC42_1993 [Sphaceloma murrayae]|uniref:Rhodopsin domain-containing protein n=1 Tax=Sphaceloma murrayae TaxID=2082308 RepID=A0A2K1QHY0_9PEZI|nr:hypothetical protein CAC42_1993 [Sphaceloma murrayae]
MDDGQSQIQRIDGAGTSLGPELLRVSIVLAVLTVLVASHRLFFVWTKRGTVGIEEILLAIAVLFLIALTATGGAAVHNGLGHYLLAFPSIGGSITVALQLNYASTVLYQILIPLRKLIILTLYLRLFPYRRIPQITQIAIAITSTVSFVFLLLTVFQCRPVSAIYTLAPAICLGRSAIQYAFTAFSILSDIVIFALPIPALQTLKSKRARHVSTGTLLILATLFVALAAARAGAIASTSNARDQGDLTYAPVRVLIWNHVEASFGLICTCAPSLKQPVKKFWGVSVTLQRSVRSGASHVGSQISHVATRVEKGRTGDHWDEWEREVGNLPMVRQSESGGRLLGVSDTALVGSLVSVNTIGRKSNDTARSKHKSTERRKSATTSVRSTATTAVKEEQRLRDMQDVLPLAWAGPTCPGQVWMPSTSPSGGSEGESSQSTPMIRSIQDSSERLLKLESSSASTPSLATSPSQQLSSPDKSGESRDAPSQPQMKSTKSRQAKHIAQMRRQSDDPGSSKTPRRDDVDLEKGSVADTGKERRHTTDAILGDGSTYGDVAELSYAMSWGSDGGEELEEVKKMFRAL